MSSDHLAQLEPMRKLLPREASRGHEGECDLLRHDDRCPRPFGGRSDESRKSVGSDSSRRMESRTPTGREGVPHVL